MHRSLPRLEVEVARAIDAGEIERALEDIQRTVEALIYRPLFTARLFSSETLDRLCQAAGRRVLQEAGPVGGARRRSRVFVATHVYATGGHTAVLEDFVRHAEGVEKHIVFTGAVRPWDRDVAHRRFGALDCTPWFAPRGALSRKLGWLIGRLTALAPERLFLFNHHQDAVAIAAAQPELAGETVYYHHADHQLALGVHLPHAVHVDPHPMGFHNCRTRLGIPANVYCPISVKDRGVVPADRGAAPGPLLSCTVAGRNKIEPEPDYPYPYWEIVPEFLHRTGGTHLHIGTLSARTVNAIRRRMRAFGLAPERFEIAARVRDVWAELLERRVGVYLCSFPYGGVRAGIEAMGAGVPVIAHVHCRSDFLGAADATYPASFRWRTPAELWDIARGLSAEVLARHARLARAHYEAFHREAILREFLARRALAGPFRDPPAPAPAVSRPATDSLQAGLSELGGLCPPSPKSWILRLGRLLRLA